MLYFCRGTNRRFYLFKEIVRQSKLSCLMNSPEKEGNCEGKSIQFGKINDGYFQGSKCTMLIKRSAHLIHDFLCPPCKRQVTFGEAITNTGLPSSVWGITWLSAGMCHLRKCRSEKIENWHTCSSAAIHLAKCTDWSLIQVTSRTVVGPQKINVHFF